VWLPGNYAIKKANPKKKQPSTTPVKGKSWSALSNTHEPWQYQYVAGACKAGRGQFHDSHEEPYSATVRSNLAKIVTALSTHLDSPCPDCSGKKKVLPPPHRIKRRLYALSQTLRGFVQGPPQAWKAPWFTSQKWSEKIFEDGEIKEDFLKAYANARVTDPAEVVVDDED